MGRPLSYYLGLVTSQHQNKPKFTAVLAGLLQMVLDAQSCIESIGPAFDLDTAVGVQLDTLGVIVGVSRNLPFNPTGGPPMLIDSDYRTIIKAKIAKNRWDGRIGSLQGVWSSLFPGGSIAITDGFYMTMAVTLNGAFSLPVRDCITHDMVVPRPQGVQLTAASSLPVFGWDYETSAVSGWDVGKW